MGRKVHPLGFRIGVIRDWQAKWYADKHYVALLQEDLKLRQAIRSKYNEAGISLVEIDHLANKVSMNIYTARPGIVIGRGGQRVDEMRRHLENLIGKRIQLNIQEIRQPELDAYLVARSVAEQIERRVSYRRAMKQAVFRTIQAGAKGIRISCAGRLGGVEIARRETTHEGQVPLHTLRADIDYGFTEARVTLGRIGVKVWIYKGDILPESKIEEVEEMAAEPVASGSTEVGAEATPAVEPEEKPTKELEEKPTKPVVRRRAKATPSPKPKEKPAEPAAEVGAEATPVVEPEEKPAKPVARRRAKAAPSPKPKEKPAEPAAEVGAEATPVVEPEEKPAKPVARRRAKAATSPKPEEKPAEPAADITTEAEPSTSEEKEETDAAT